MVGFKFALEKNTASFVFKIKMFRITAAQSFHKFAYAAVNALLKNHMIMVWIKTITDNIYQLRRPTSKWGFVKRILINAAYGVYGIKFPHALKKSLKVITTSKDGAPVCAAIINVVKLAVCECCFSHNNQ